MLLEVKVKYMDSARLTANGHPVTAGR
jgi:hypothetical protein